MNIVKLFWLKNKKIILIVLAIFFLVAIFNLSRNEIIYQNNSGQENGLVYSTTTLENLITDDTDGDEVLDWEEGLWGTDPTKKDTDGDGVLDRVEIERLRAETLVSTSDDYTATNTEKLTETDKFSREFFATMVTLNQNGAMDQATVDKLGISLAEKIQSSVPRKIFLPSDIKVIPNNSVETIENYNNMLDSIHNKYPVEGNAVDVLKKFLIDENNVDTSVLSELDPIIKQTNNIISAMAKMSVPEDFVSLHLSFLNALESVSENITDIKFYDSDVIIALSGISQYEKNSSNLILANNNLVNAIKQRLSN